MFVAMSRFVVSNGMEEDVCAAFRRRPHMVDAAPGFVRMEVLRPFEQPEEFWLLTWWTDEESYRRWHRSHAYHESHAGIPRGLKLVRGETRITLLEQVAS